MKTNTTTHLAQKNSLSHFLKPNIQLTFPQDFEILGWCTAGPVLPHGEKVPL